MKIAIVNVQAPFLRGGAEVLADSLYAKLVGLGHEVEAVNIPFKWYPESTLLDGIMACRLMRLDAGEPDLVIALKFPAYLAEHPNKKVWLLHQFRQAYDLWGTPLGQLPDNAEGRTIRDLVARADEQHLTSAKAIYTISRNVANRLRRFNSIEANGVLYPPLMNQDLYRSAPPGDYFYYPSRLNVSKRQHVAIEAMRHVRSPFRLLIAGVSDDPDYETRLRQLIHQWGLGHKVQLLGRVSEKDKAQHLADCVGVLFLPFDEDYGYVTVEAFQSSKPVITFSDGGGTTELVEDGRNGRIVEPNVETLAQAMEWMWARRGQNDNMGREALATIPRLGIEWPHVLERLVA
jgi:glycosyltransferase involved in cell wall biosynthesis